MTARDLEDFPVDGVVKAVIDRLQQKDPESPFDVYVWDDGSVSNQKTTETEGLRLVSLFSPADDPAPEEIRESIVNGVRAILERHADDTEVTGEHDGEDRSAAARER